MKRILTTAVLIFSSQFALAQAGDCAARAMSKEGKPLAGAAKTAFMKKCEAEARGPAANPACEGKAIDKNGKPLHGAAKDAFLKKCNADANTANK